MGARAAGSLGVALAVGMGGCTAGPDYRPPESPVPAFFVDASRGSPAEPADRWWLAFGDPTMNALIGQALADNPDLAAAEARVAEARAVARATGAALWPGAQAAGDVSRDKLSRNGENLALIPFRPSTTEFTDTRVGIEASWELDLAGRTRREVEAATARFGSQLETRNDALVVVAAEVAAAYIDERVAAERLRLGRRSTAILAASRRLIGLQRDAGIASEADLRRAAADAQRGSALAATFEALRAAARARLAALTGRTRGELAAALDASGAIPSSGLPPIGLPSDLLRRRPDIRRAERDLAAATADVGAAVAAQFPRLSLTGDAGFDSVRSGDLVNAASRFWNLAPGISVPLFTAGRLRHEADAARAARDAALAAYRGTVLRAFADVDMAVVRLAGDRSNAAGLNSAAAELDMAYQLERARFEAGDTSQLDLLAAEQAANRAADQRAESAGQLSLDVVALNRALGGGWHETAAAQ